MGYIWCSPATGYPVEDGNNLSSSPAPLEPVSPTAAEPVPALPAASADTSSAVTDITGKSSFFDSLLDKKSPLTLGATFSETYDDNIYLTRKKTSDYVTLLSPLATYTMGDQQAANANYFTALLQPGFVFYAENSSQTTQNVLADAAFQHQWTRLMLGIDQSYNKSSSSTIQANNIVESSEYDTKVKGTYDYNDRLSISGDMTQRITTYQETAYAGSNEWAVESSINYEIVPKVKIGIGPRIDFLDIQRSPNQTAQQLLAHLSYAASGKTSVTFGGGAEYREFQGNVASKLNPVFDLTVNYQVFDGTALSLHTSESTTASYDTTGQNIVATAIQVGLTQRLLKNYSLSLSSGYQHNEYEASSSGSSGNLRTDDYLNLGCGLTWSPNDYLSTGVSYRYSRDETNAKQSSFNDNQINFQVGVQF